MPVHDHHVVSDDTRARLAQALCAEWQQPHQENPDGHYPEIHLVEGENQFPVGRRLKLVVIWDAWSELSLQERAAIIMDAFQEAAKEPEDLLRVTLALGLTRSTDDARILQAELH